MAEDLDTLAQLNRRFGDEEARGPAGVPFFGAQAFVEASVRLKGVRDDKPAEGVFRNLRLFEKQERDWRCVLWFNKKAGPL